MLDKASSCHAPKKKKKKKNVISTSGDENGVIVQLNDAMFHKAFRQIRSYSPVRTSGEKKLRFDDASGPGLTPGHPERLVVNQNRRGTCIKTSFTQGTCKDKVKGQLR
jgi:hypothetical protein